MKRLVSTVRVAAFACLLSAVVFVATREGENSATEPVHDIPKAGSGSASGLSVGESRTLRRAESDARKDSAGRDFNGAGAGGRAPTRAQTREAAAWPADIENRIWEYFAHRGKSNITSIISVECNPTDCEIVFTGTELNPRIVDTFSDLYSDMFAEPWNVQQGSISTREIAPGVRAYVIGISNIPYDSAARETAEPDGTSNPRDD